MKKVYLVAGLGADVRLFKHLDLSDYEVTDVAWIEPDQHDTLTAYSQKLIRQYDIQPGSNIIGVSLGGMIAVEIAKMVPMRNVIIISSIKTIDEAPFYYKIFRALPVYKMIPAGLMVAMGNLLKPFFSKRMGGESHLFNAMLKNSSPVFLKWAMHAALHWDGQLPDQHIHHIIGTKDLIFDYRKIKEPILITGGDHMIVFTKAKQINPIIRNILPHETTSKFLYP